MQGYDICHAKQGAKRTTEWFVGPHWGQRPRSCSSVVRRDRDCGVVEVGVDLVAAVVVVVAIAVVVVVAVAARLSSPGAWGCGAAVL